MNTYDELLRYAQDNNIVIDDMASLKNNERGYHVSIENLGVILINKYVDTFTERKCILAEELGHYFKTVGNITDQTKIENRKQERVARKWGYDRLIPLHKLAEAIDYPCQNKNELAEYLGITVEYLEEALHYYKERYGLYCKFNEYTIYFEPLSIMKEL